jgi:hypothetical protein
VARRRRIDPLVVVGLIGLALFGGVVWWFTSQTPPREEPQPLPAVVDAGVSDLATERVDAGPSEPDLLSEKRPRTRRGRLVKRELERKRMAQKGGLGGRAGAEASEKVNVVLSPSESAAALSGTFARKLRGVRVVPTASRGWYVTLKMQSGGTGDAAWVRCSATLSELPDKKLGGALSARADVTGEGADRDELIEDAADACAASLAQDVSAWIRQRG